MTNLINKDWKKWCFFLSNIQSKRIVIFLNWFPNDPDNKHFIVDIFLWLWIDVLTFSYSGTHKSSWKFSIENSIQDTSFWYNNLCTNSINKINKIYDEIILFWNSYWSFILWLFLKSYRVPKTKKIFFMSSLWWMDRPEVADYLINDIDELDRYLLESRPFAYRFEEKNDFLLQLKWIKKIKSGNLHNTIDDTYILIWEHDQKTPYEMSLLLSRDFPNSILKIIWGWHSSQIDQVSVKHYIKANI